MDKKIRKAEKYIVDFNKTLKEERDICSFLNSNIAENNTQTPICTTISCGLEIFVKKMLQIFQSQIFNT